MSQQDKQPFFFQQFVVFFLLITAIQVAFSYFELDAYFWGRSTQSAITNQEIPPITGDKQTGLSTIKVIEKKTPSLTVGFNEKTGQIHEISLENYWTDMQKNQKISTIFQHNESKKQEEQAISEEFLILNTQTETYEKALSLKTQVISEKNTIIIENEYSRFYTKTIYDFTDEYTINKEIQITAKSPVEIYSYTELRNKNTALVKGTEQGFRMFQGASFHTEKTKYSKIPFAQFAKKSFKEEATTGGWIAFSQRYFATAISTDNPSTLYSNYIPSQNICVAGLVSRPIRLESGEQIALSSKIYSGPEDRTLLSNFAPGLEYVIDFGMFWPVCDLLLSSLVLLQKIFQDWGLSIISLTILIRGLSFAISIPQQKTLKKMEMLRPQQEALKHKFAGDDIAYNKAMWELHKKEKINYVSVIFATIINPILQIPVFLGFYSLLMESITLRQTTLLGVSGDLSLADPTYTLSAIFLASSLLQQRYSPPIQNSDMAAAMRIMPFIFSAVTTTLPSGLLIYWISSNILAALMAFILAKKTDERKA